MLKITFSNCFSKLLEALESRLDDDAPSSVFVPQEVIVSSAATGRFLSLAIAGSKGICANVGFHYLASWFWKLIGLVVPVSDESPYAAEVLVWRIFGILEDDVFVSRYPRLMGWLQKNDQVGRFELAGRIAGLFESYLTYRPNWLRCWFGGKRLGVSSSLRNGKWPDEDEVWQAALWRRIEEDIGSDGVHPAERFFAALEEDEGLPGLLPQRVHVFCLPTIAPQYLKMLGSISRWVDVELYVMNPCREFWFDVVSGKQLSRLEKAGRAMYRDTGNELLASWGTQTQSHLSLLMEIASEDFVEDACFFSNADAGVPVSLLSQLQDAVLDLQELALPEGIASADESIEVHVCHSLMREVEVLYDRLLGLFAADTSLLPGDVVVVTPDIDAVAPMVDAVFGNQPQGARIPYLVTGRADNRINPVARALEDVLALVSSRFTARDVFGFLMQPLVARRFGLADDLDRVYSWLDESGVCWGLDGEQKVRLDLPFDDSCSFFDGFYRLFLAYALPSSFSLPFGARLPAANPEGLDALALGNLWHFVSKLSLLRDAISLPRDADGWHVFLLGVMDDFLDLPGAETDDVLTVRREIARLSDNMRSGSGGITIQADVVRQALSDVLKGSARGALPSGVVTFTTMGGLRYLPYRVVCAIGINDGVFPGNVRPLEFDLLALVPQKGDLQRRENDRNIFLDLLLSAREKFYVSYTGRSIRDNSLFPPSVMVSALLDYVVNAFSSGNRDVSLQEAKRQVWMRLVVEHPLQAFSPLYFMPEGDLRFQSHRHDFCLAQQERFRSRHLLQDDFSAAVLSDEEDEEADVYDAGSAPPFFSKPLPLLDDAWRSVSLEQLLQFFDNPCRFLLRNRMGIGVLQEKEDLPSDEPFVADNLDLSRLSGRILPLLLEGRDRDEVFAVARAGNEFPPGKTGSVALEAAFDALETFAERIRPNLDGDVLDEVFSRFSFDLEGEVWSLEGALHDLRPDGLFRYRYVHSGGNSAARFRLGSWVVHLFFNAVVPEVCERKTVCFFRDETQVFRPMPQETAFSLLEELILLYRTGLSEPLRFFPASAQALFDEKGNVDIGKAERKWKDVYRDEGEAHDFFNRLAMRGIADPLDDVFVRYARQIIEPLYAFTEKE